MTLATTTVVLAGVALLLQLLLSSTFEHDAGNYLHLTSSSRGTRYACITQALCVRVPAEGPSAKPLEDSGKPTTSCNACGSAKIAYRENCRTTQKRYHEGMRQKPYTVVDAR